MHRNGHDRLGRGADGLAADGDAIHPGGDFLAQRCRCAVYPDLTLGDEGLGRTTRTHPRISEKFLQSERFG